MKKCMISLLLLLVCSTGFTESMVLNNETIYPLKKQNTKIAIQWAISAKEMQEANKALLYGLKLNPNTMQMISKSGKMLVNIPKNAGYFRVLAWSKAEENPDLLTNWVDVVVNKIYLLHNDQLVPAVLMSGAGC